MTAGLGRAGRKRNPRPQREATVPVLLKEQGSVGNRRPAAKVAYLREWRFNLSGPLHHHLSKWLARIPRGCLHAPGPLNEFSSKHLMRSARELCREEKGYEGEHAGGHQRPPDYASRGRPSRRRGPKPLETHRRLFSQLRDSLRSGPSRGDSKEYRHESHRSVASTPNDAITSGSKVVRRRKCRGHMTPAGMENFSRSPHCLQPLG